MKTTATLQHHPVFVFESTSFRLLPDRLHRGISLQLGEDCRDTLIWKDSYEGGGDVFICIEDVMWKGHYLCQKDDIIDIRDKNKTIKINKSSPSKQRFETSDLKRLNIDEVIDGKSPYECLKNCIGNKKAFMHMLRYTTKKMSEKESKILLQISKDKNEFESAEALKQNMERQGIKFDNNQVANRNSSFLFNVFGSFMNRTRSIAQSILCTPEDSQ